MKDREIVGYEKNPFSGSLLKPIYVPAKGAIVSRAFITCMYCDKTVYHCMGPKQYAICLGCFREEFSE
jgi:hypothetical protein